MNDDENILKKKNDIDIIPMEDLMPMGNPKQPEQEQKVEPIIENKSEIINENTFVTDNNPNNNEQVNKVPTNDNIINNEPVNENIPNNNDTPIVKENENVNQTVISQKPVMESSNNINTSNAKSNDFVKIIMIVVLLAAIAFGVYYILNSGPSRTLVCNHSGLYMDNEMSITVKNDKIDKIGLKVTYDLSEFTDELKEKAKSEDSCKSFKSSYEELYEFTDCHQQVSGDKVIISMNLKIKTNDNSATSEELSTFRENLEKTGYTCNFK